METKEVKTIGNEVAKAVEEMKIASGMDAATTQVEATEKQNEETGTTEKKEKITEKKNEKGEKNAKKVGTVEKKKNEKQNAEELEKEITRKSEELQKCLAELERKKKLSNNRRAFMDAMDNLNAAAEKLDENPDFETKLYRLYFRDASAYNGNEIFTISNHFILREFVTFMCEKIKVRISEIEQELIAG